MTRSKAVLKVCAAAFILGFTTMSASAQQQTLYFYTSFKDSMLQRLKAAFEKQHPTIKLEPQVAGAGKLMAKIAAERESGKILADLLWTSEVPDFYQLREAGLLLKYEPKELKAIFNPIPDYDGSFTPVRLGNLAVAYNTKKIKEPPKTWEDLKKPAYKGALGIANPSLSGTAYMAAALLSQEFGWKYFEELRANGAKMGKGSGQVLDDTASGDLVACLGVDYMTYDKMSKGANIALAFMPQMLVFPSPIAIFKNSPNKDAAIKFVDFMLSKEAQQIISDEGTMPVRLDVKTSTKYNLPTVEEAKKRAIKIDYANIMNNKEHNVKTFTDIMQKRK